jgi:uncharacterized hydrophobic protein (TIGR00271 family)
MSSKQKNTTIAVAQVLDRAKPDVSYSLLLVGAALIAAGGIFTDSIPLLIASMIVAPLSAPILLLGLGLAAGNWKLIGRALGILAASAVIVLSISLLAAVILQHDRIPDILISFDSNRIIAIGIAVIAGIIAAYGTVSPKVSATGTGIAIAVSLMPPLVATGVGLAPGGAPFTGALSLFLLNVLGIAVASAATFVTMGIARSYRQRP